MGMGPLLLPGLEGSLGVGGALPATSLRGSPSSATRAQKVLEAVVVRGEDPQLVRQVLYYMALTGCAERHREHEPNGAVILSHMPRQPEPALWL